MSRYANLWGALSIFWMRFTHIFQHLQAIVARRLTSRRTSFASASLPTDGSCRSKCTRQMLSTVYVKGFRKAHTIAATGDSTVFNLFCCTNTRFNSCNISGVLLELLRMGITDITSFEFMEMPSPDAIVAAIRELKLLDAIDVDEHDDDHHRRVERYALTDIGRQLVSFPLAPNHAK